MKKPVCNNCGEKYPVNKIRTIGPKKEKWWQVLQQEYAQQQRLDGPQEVIELSAPYDWDLNEKGLRVDPAKVQIRRRWLWDDFLRLFGDFDDPEELLYALEDKLADKDWEEWSIDEIINELKWRKK